MRPDEILWDLRMIERHPIQKEEGGGKRGGEEGGERGGEEEGGGEEGGG